MMFPRFVLRARIVPLFFLGLNLPVSLAHGQTSGTSSYPIKLSSSGSYLLDQDNRPFFINGDTAWSLIVQLSPTDADTYLSDRAQKGYNLILVNLIEHKFATNAPANLAGQPPFTTPGNFNTPNEAYFDHVDWVIKKAAEKGLVVLLAPLYLGSYCGSEGWCAEVIASSLASIRRYGRYLGNRYKNFPNIIWLVGGDTDPVADGVASRVREFVAGVQEFDTTHFFTAHNRNEQAAMDVWTSEPWLNINNIYTYNDAYPMALRQFNRRGAKPFFLLETYYENEHSSTPLSLRRQAYWTVLSGGVVGHVFGNCPIWHFNAPSGSSFCAGATWQSQLSSAGATTLAYLGWLFASRAFCELVPDQGHSVLTAGFQSGTNYASAARASDGSSVIAYIPTRRTVTIALSQIAGTSARAWWFNPRTAVATLINTYPTSGTTTFTPPDANDWVLVLDNASLNLPAPGTLRQPLVITKGVSQSSMPSA
ncbi:MAG: glycoside hydrolase family 140 protein [Pyrinomonadaceae bacterium]